MNPLKNLSCPGCGYEIPISLAASARHLSHKCPNCHSRELHEFVAPAELDDDDPMWLADSQIDGLFEGFCGPEDHRGIIHFLRCTGLSESVVKRVHEAICLYRPAAQEKQMPSGYALIAAARKHVLGHATFYLRPVQSTPVELTDDENAAPAAPAAQALTDAARDVLTERQRQTSVKGWTPEHDDAHRDCQLAAAAATYAMCQQPQQLKVCGVVAWPWPLHWWKPTSYRRNLVKAGALILAEIERLDRAASAKGDKR